MGLGFSPPPSVPFTGAITGNITVTSAAPQLLLADNTSNELDALFRVDADNLQIRDSAKAANTLMSIDLCNNRVGVGVAPTVRFEVSGNTILGGTLLVSGDITLDATLGQLILPQTPSAVSLAFGDGDTGFNEPADDNLAVRVGGAERMSFSTIAFAGGVVGAPSITMGAGTAAQPTYGFNSDTDTGMYRSGTNAISFVTSGNTQLSISQAGLATFSDEVHMANNTPFRIRNAADSGNLTVLFANGTNDVVLGGNSVSGMIFNTSAVEAMRIDNNGDVGIGTAAPAFALDLSESSNSASDVYAMRIVSNNAGAGDPGGIDVSSFTVDEPIFSFPEDVITTAVGTLSGQVAVNINGTIRYIALYTHGS